MLIFGIFISWFYFVSVFIQLLFAAWHLHVDADLFHVHDAQCITYYLIRIAIWSSSASEERPIQQTHYFGDPEQLHHPFYKKNETKHKYYWLARSLAKPNNRDKWHKLNRICSGRGEPPINWIAGLRNEENPKKKVKLTWTRFAAQLVQSPVCSKHIKCNLRFCFQFFYHFWWVQSSDFRI